MKGLELETVKGKNYIYLALYAFGGLGSEVIYAYLLEPMIYGVSMQDWTVGECVIHWIVTCITWGMIAYGIIKLSIRKYGFDLFETKKKMKAWQWICIFLCIVFVLYISFNDWGGFKPFMEYQSKGMLKFVFQYIYYAFETVLFTLILAFGQKACEVWFGNERIPYGGVVVAVTWGLVHILTKGSVMTGVLCAVAGASYGVAYLLLNKDIKKTFIVLFIMFVI